MVLGFVCHILEICCGGLVRASTVAATSVTAQTSVSLSSSAMRSIAPYAVWSGS